MTDLDRLRQAHADLGATLASYDLAARRIHDANPAWPGAASYDGPGGRSADSTSTVERLAERKDPTALARKQLADLARSLPADALMLRRLVEAWTPKPASARSRAEAERENAHDPACQCCTDHRKPGNVKLVHATGDVSGNLRNPDGTPLTMALCRWCYDFVGRTGALPKRADVERHDAGLRVMVKA